MNYKMTMILLILLLIFVTPVYATVENGIVDITSTIPESIKGDLQYYITNTTTQEVFSATLLHKYDYNGKIELPYGKYSITFIGLTVPDPDLYEVDYGKMFEISGEIAVVSVTVEKKEISIPDETGWAALTANVPEDFYEPVFITISSEIENKQYRLFHENDYKDYVELPIGEYMVLNAGVENDNAGDYMASEAPDFTVEDKETAKTAAEVVVDIAERVPVIQPEKSGTPEDTADTEKPLESEEPQDKEDDAEKNTIEDNEDKDDNIAMKRIIFGSIILVILAIVGIGVYIFFIRE